jgi:hypothetical protein
MNVRFFYKSSGDDAPKGFDFFIREDGTVWRDNFQTYESQCAVIGFEDCIMPCPEIGWAPVPPEVE